AGGTTLVHTGDFKLDLSPVDGQLTDLGRLGELGERGVDLLLSDSTNAEVRGVTPSEQLVAQTFERLFAQAKGRLFVALFGSHLHRVQHLLRLASRAGRKALVWGRSLERTVPDGLLVNADALAELADEQVLVVCTGAQAEPRSALMTMLTWEGSPVRI